MSSLEALWTHPVAEALGCALARFVWQGAAVALAVGALLACMGRRPAYERYALACLGLLVMAVLPVASFSSELAGAASGDSSGPAALGDGAVTGALLAPLATWVKGWLWTLRPWLMSAWLCGVLLLSLRTAWAWRQAQVLAREGTQQPEAEVTRALARMMERTRVSRPMRLLESIAVEVPTVVGLWKPLILVPPSTLTGLSVPQLEAVLAHELAHIRRHDYLVNLLQALVETVLFYHPAVWWLSARIREEREHCADDVAVECCGDAVMYSRALATLEQLRVRVPAPALAANGGSLLQRIQRLLAAPRGGAPLHPWRLAGSLAALMLLVVLGTARQSQATGAPSQSPAPEAAAAATPAAATPAPATHGEEAVPFNKLMTWPEQRFGDAPQFPGPVLPAQEPAGSVPPDYFFMTEQPSC
ncbi:M56 family metallopeptidase [Hyalangium minutum]|uniref:Regulatory sensor-transducer, BlaR1/MecR1 family protein n=1 Tax=Hyalangium minutum TaxID=394096 RepID=A0A085WFU7_9BACT|nr:M56 family metallopeptidase [Hyalangium minutum]KFE66560.1 Regulatory sensor-transducer, BlaR1/MecR1 family protein [Hyalangium minutum]